MSKSTNVSSGSEGIDAELELSAEELIALSNDPQLRQQASPTTQSPQPSKDSRHKLSQSLSLIAAVGVIGATYVLTSPKSSPQSVANTWQPTAQSEEPAPQQLAEGEPVRFANPFDADEVFEFPPGTPETQARDAVAEVLLKRAMSRQKT